MFLGYARSGTREARALTLWSRVVAREGGGSKDGDPMGRVARMHVSFFPLLRHARTREPVQRVVVYSPKVGVCQAFLFAECPP